MIPGLPIAVQGERVAVSVREAPAPIARGVMVVEVVLLDPDSDDDGPALLSLTRSWRESDCDRLARQPQLASAERLELRQLLREIRDRLREARTPAAGPPAT